jgi:hypothetical protein
MRLRAHLGQILKVMDWRSGADLFRNLEPNRLVMMIPNPSIPANDGLTLKAFRRARWQAKVEQVRARLTGQSADLLCYWEVQDLLMPKASHKIGCRDVPLASIVGSVGRCGDYTRGFLPLKDSDEHRWVRVKAALSQAKPLPPIQVYQVGEVYFVADGNHRVSVARQQGMPHIEAHVIQIQAKVPLLPRDRTAELVLKSEYARFLERTRLDEIRPGADLQLTVAGRYGAFESQIEAHRAFLALDQRREVPEEEAVGDWYDKIYLPAVQVIGQRDLLRGFSGWTEADLYLALCDHRIALEEAVGQEVELELAAADLARQVGTKTRGTLARVGQGFWHWIRTRNRA